MENEFEQPAEEREVVCPIFAHAFFISPVINQIMSEQKITFKELLEQQLPKCLGEKCAWWVGSCRHC